MFFVDYELQLIASYTAYSSLEFLDLEFPLCQIVVQSLFQFHIALYFVLSLLPIQPNVWSRVNEGKLLLRNSRLFLYENPEFEPEP